MYNKEVTKNNGFVQKNVTQCRGCCGITSSTARKMLPTFYEQLYVLYKSVRRRRFGEAFSF